MIFKSETLLFCRCCGKPIRKWTERNYVKPTAQEHDRNLGKVHYGTFRSKANCEAVADGRVISVRYHNHGVHSFTTWDGKSYVDRYFCTNKCAIQFAYYAAMGGTQMPAYKTRLQSTARVGGSRRVGL